MNNPSLQNRMLIYIDRSEQLAIEVQTDGETVWLTQVQLVRLFDSRQFKPREIGRFPGISSTTILT